MRRQAAGRERDAKAAEAHERGAAQNAVTKAQVAADKAMRRERLVERSNEP